MVEMWLNAIHGWWNRLCSSLFPEPRGMSASGRGSTPRVYGRLERVVLTDQVCRSLFDGFAAHRRTARGDEEIGWVLLGVRDEREALALATLPAGAHRDAGVAHVAFNHTAQAVASRIVRQWDRRLQHLGVVHTHPGSLRHPSGGDFHGDSQWVANLRGGEGIFGIGTADAHGESSGCPGQTHLQVLGDLCFSWYVLGKGDGQYRKAPVEIALGPDLARSLHPLWETLEHHAAPLERLGKQLAGVVFETVRFEDQPALKVSMPAADAGKVLMILQGDEARFFFERGAEVTAIDPEEGPLDRAVFLILAEVAGQSARQMFSV